MFFKFTRYTACYFLVYLLIFVFVRQFYPSPIIFYQGIVVNIILLILSLSLLFLVKRDEVVKTLTAISIVVGFLVSYSFHITIPSLLDRSISLYIIGLTHESGGENISQYKQDFYSGFINKNGAVEKRVNEQLVSGNIICDNICTLTEKGESIYKLNIFLANLFNVDSRYVNPGMH